MDGISEMAGAHLTRSQYLSRVPQEVSRGVLPVLLVSSSFLHLLHRRASQRLSQGYDVLPKSFQISPELFAPERLCSCLPGWRLEETQYSQFSSGLEWFAVVSGSIIAVLTAIWMHAR